MSRSNDKLLDLTCLEMTEKMQFKFNLWEFGYYNLEPIDWNKLAKQAQKIWRNETLGVFQEKPPKLRHYKLSTLILDDPYIPAKNLLPTAFAGVSLGESLLKQEKGK